MRFEGRRFWVRGTLVTAAVGHWVAESDLDDALVTYEEDGASHEVLRSTVLTEVILHAVEHRAQIAAALKAGGFPTPELQDFSVWPFAEGRGR